MTNDLQHWSYSCTHFINHNDILLTTSHQYHNNHGRSNRVPTPLLTKKSRTFPGISRTLMKNFPGPFWSPRMFKYKEKTAFNYNIQSVVHCRKFSKKQNVLHYFCLFSIWTTKEMDDFQGYFSRTFKDLSFNFQDFPGPKWFSRTFQVLEFSRKKNPGLFRRRGNQCYIS